MKPSDIRAQQRLAEVQELFADNINDTVVELLNDCDLPRRAIGAIRDAITFGIIITLAYSEENEDWKRN